MMARSSLLLSPQQELHHGFVHHHACQRQALSIGIEGMTCSSCAARVEKLLGRLPGISKATVSFSTESALLESDSVVDLTTCAPGD
jgi:copper chaperone CopZ